MDIMQRIKKRIKIDEESGCWEWQGVLVSKRYGTMSVKGKMYLVHRLAYEAMHGPIPKGLYCCHKCDNTVCCNPDHIFLGTQKDNMQDASRKGRMTGARGDLNGRRTHPERTARGEGHAKAVLTEKQVIHIRDTFAAGGVTKRAFAEEFGVTPEAIHAIVIGKTWKHLLTPSEAL